MAPTALPWYFGETMVDNAQIIKQFYAALNERNAQAMVSLYAPDVLFSDPIYTDLSSLEASSMWRMLCAHALDLSVVVSDIRVDLAHGRAHWQAKYRFGPKKRWVVNEVDAEFEFRKGLIWRHRDRFDFSKWAGQALGMHVPLLLPFFPSIRAKTQAAARQSLDQFIGSRPKVGKARTAG